MKRSRAISQSRERGYVEISRVLTTLLFIGIMMFVITLAFTSLDRIKNSLMVGDPEAQLTTFSQSLQSEYKDWLAKDAGGNPNTFLIDSAQKLLANSTLKSSNLFLAYDKKQVCVWTDAKNSSGKGVDASVGYVDGKVTNCLSMTRVDKTISVDSSAPAPAAPAPAPVEQKQEDKTPAPEFPWSMVGGIVVTGAGGLAVVSGGVAGVKFLLRRKKQSKRRDREWKAFFVRHDAVKAQWAEYELDPLKMLEFPLMSDMSIRETSKAQEALRTANALRPEKVSEVRNEKARDSDYAKAVVSAETTFSAAEHYAKKIKWNRFSRVDRKRLEKAQALIRLALNDGATEAERQTAYRQLVKEINGLIILPTITLKTIETKVNLMLTTGRSSDILESTS